LLVEDFDSSSKDIGIFNASAKGQIEFKFNSNSEQLKNAAKKGKDALVKSKNTATKVGRVALVAEAAAYGATNYLVENSPTLDASIDYGRRDFASLEGVESSSDSNESAQERLAIFKKL